MVAGRRGHDRRGAVPLELLDRRQRAAPLERAELMDVLALEIEIPAATQGFRRAL
jgi:hypothetical protein